MTMFKKLIPLLLLASALQAQTVAYVANSNDNTVSVIDTSTNTVTATIVVGGFPIGVVFSPDGTRAFVTNQSGSSISVINTASNTVVATVALPAGALPSRPQVLAITPDGSSLYVPDVSNNDVLVISTATNSVIATIPVGTQPTSVAVTPDGAHAYVLGLGFVSVIATATNTISAGPISVNSGGVEIASPGLAVTPAGDFVYVSPEGNGNLVTVISTASNTVSATVSVPGAGLLDGLAITPDGSRVYIADLFNNVDVIDTATNTLEPSSIPAGSLPNAVAITPDGAFLYVTDLGSNTVSVIDTSTTNIVATVGVGSGNQVIAIAPLHAPLATLTIENLVINNNLHEQGDFALGANTGGIDLAHQPLTLTANNFSLTIPAGSFKQVGGNMHFVFNGTVNGFKVNFNIQAEHGSSTQFDFVFDVHGVSITGPNPATVGLKIGHNSGTTTAPF
ncbi:MAG: hypothetical protein WA738_11210 [Candidatus Angelobacter sp.]